MQPGAPETTARGFAGLLLAANSSIREPMAAHDGRVVDVASVDHDRLPHRALEAAQVEVAKLVPFRDHDHGVGAGGRLVSALHVLDVRQDTAGYPPRPPGVSPHPRPPPPQGLCELRTLAPPGGGPRGA